jgi:hypothetical protein
MSVYAKSPTRMAQNYFVCASAARAYVRGDLAWLRAQNLGQSLLTPGETAQAAMKLLAGMRDCGFPPLAQRASRAVGSISLMDAGTSLRAADLDKPRATVHRLIDRAAGNGAA